jgi:hypothetical protein
VWNLHDPNTASTIEFFPLKITASGLLKEKKIGNNSCGVHSVVAEFYGGGARCSDNVRELEVLPRIACVRTLNEDHRR